MADKATLRQQYQQLRQAIAFSDRQAAGKSAARLLSEHPLFKQSKSIAIYHATGQEFPTADIIAAIWAAHKDCYLPRITEKNKKFQFAIYTSDTMLMPNRFQILEPPAPSSTITHYDLIILPLIAFDAVGNRLGMGGGFYDATLEHLDQTFLLGLGFAIQEHTQLPVDKWDIPLHGVLTELELRIFNQSETNI